VKPPAAVVVGLGLNGLGVVRSLGGAGVPTLALETDLGSAAAATRHCRKLQVAALDGPGLIDELLRIRATLASAPVLILTKEGSVAAVSAQRDRLAGHYRFSMPGHSTMQALLDKLRFQALAQEHGFAIPRAARLGDDDHEQMLETLRFPCILKPVTKDLEYGRRFAKAYRIGSAAEGLALWREMRAVVAEVIVQEWIEGGDADVYFCLQYRPPDGGATTSFVGRKLRQWPVLVGGTASCVPAPEAAAELTDLTDRFFAAVGFVGLGSMEYKRDRRDGAFYMVEPTVGRTDFQEEVATLNGVNIPLAACRGELGLPPPPVRRARPCGWRDPFGDARALAAGSAAGPLPVPLRDAFWRAGDPGPFLALGLEALRRRLGRLLAEGRAPIAGAKRLIVTLAPERLVEGWRVAQRRRSLPPRAKAALAADRQPLPSADIGPQAAVEAAIAWLERAQDCSRSADGGVARDFSLIDGWAASYPETTGYIVPTLLAAAERTGRSELLERARRMLDWLEAIQLPGGGFQGGRVDQAPVVPVTFNTGQILIGLAAGSRAFGERRYLDAMHAAAGFLRDTQEADGAWRRHPSPFAAPGDKAYETHVAWGLFEAARLAPDNGYGEAGLRQVRWALQKQRANGWFADNCLENPAAPLTHTIGYVLRGVIEAYRFSGDAALLAAALRTGDALIRCLAEDGSMPARLDADWRAAAPYSCLTGIVQIAACWLLLAELAGRPDLAAAARLANAFVRRTVRVGRDADTDGGVKGSHPIDGDYGSFEYLNWAAKFFIDANLMEMAARPG
jgi:predicted ATP-grasp superfamily ATP-dependent carboligase